MQIWLLPLQGCRDTRCVPALLTGPPWPAPAPHRRFWGQLSPFRQQALLNARTSSWGVFLPLSAVLLLGGHLHPSLLVPHCPPGSALPLLPEGTVRIPLLLPTAPAELLRANPSRTSFPGAQSILWNCGFISPN